MKEYWEQYGYGTQFGRDMELGRDFEFRDGGMFLYVHGIGTTNISKIGLHNKTTAYPLMAVMVEPIITLL